MNPDPSANVQSWNDRFNQIPASQRYLLPDPNNTNNEHHMTDRGSSPLFMSIRPHHHQPPPNPTSRYPGLALPPMTNLNRAGSRYSGDGQDFRRPIMGNGEVLTRQPHWVDLTQDEAASDVPEESTTRSRLAITDIIDVDDIPNPAGPDTLIDLTADTADSDEVEFTGVRRVEGVNGSRPQTTAGFGTRLMAAHAAILHETGLRDGFQVIGYGSGGWTTPELRRNDHIEGAGGGQRRLPGMHIEMDYTGVAFDMEMAPARRLPSPKYSPPPAAPNGFTMQPSADEIVVCPNCGDELAVGGPGRDEVKQQMWVVRKCGHVYCGTCATSPSKGKGKGGGKGKGKGKEKVVDDGAPPPLKKCVVEGCGESVTKKALIHVYLSQ